MATYRLVTVQRTTAFRSDEFRSILCRKPNAAFHFFSASALGGMCRWMKAAAAWAALSRGMSRLIAASKDIDQHAIEMQQLVRVVDRRLASLDERQRYLDAVRPERILARGYSLTRDASGNIIRDAAQIQPGQIIHTELSQGTITSTVKTISQDANDDQTKP